MAKLAKYKGFTIFFWSFDLNEKMHVHVSKNKKQKKPAKFWLEPNVLLFDEGDLTDKEIFSIERILIKNVDTFKKMIEGYRQGKRFKPLQIKK